MRCAVDYRASVGLAFGERKRILAAQHKIVANRS